MLQVYTEWFNPPQPRVITAEDDGITHDAYLDFGNLFMGRGAALFTQGQADPVPVEAGAIYKHWGQIGGRDWLIEEIRYPVVASLLQTLPLHAAVGKPVRGSIYERIASSPPLRPKSVADAGTPVKVAKSVRRQPALVLDYDLVSSVSNFTFQCDSTYYISNSVTLGGTNTIFEGGTILKYESNVTLTVNSPITWKAGSYRPVILTCKDDDIIGDIIDDSTGIPTNYSAKIALSYNASVAGTNLSLQHLRVMHAVTAVAINGNSNHVVGNVQMVYCQNGLAASNTTFSLWNGLMYRVLTNFTGTNATGDVEHLTVDTASLFNTNQTLNMTNCLVVAVTNSGTGINSSNTVYTLSSPGTVFQTVGSGSHYLAANSPYVNAGTAKHQPRPGASPDQHDDLPAGGCRAASLRTTSPILLKCNAIRVFQTLATITILLTLAWSVT